MRELARHASTLRPPPAALRGATPAASADFTAALHRALTRCVELLRPQPAGVGARGARRVASGASSVRREGGLVGATGGRAPTLTMTLAMALGLSLSLTPTRGRLAGGRASRG